MPLTLFLPLILALPAQDPDLFGPVGGSAPRQVWVQADTLLVFEEPDDAGYITDRVPRGTRLAVLKSDPSGWLAIEPPERSFSWVERSAVEDLGAGRGRISAGAAAVRPGSESARLPGATWTVLRRGDFVRLLDRPPLIVRQGGGRTVWLAVAPPEGELRYVRADATSPLDPKQFPEGAAGEFEPFFLPEPGGDDRRSSLASRTGRPQPIDPSFATVGPAVSTIGLGPQFAGALARAEAGHRAVLVLPIESWQLDRARRDYEALRAMAATPQERSIVDSRLGQLDRQETAARAARQLAALVETSRQRDAEVDAVRRRLDAMADPSAAPFEAEGLLNRSSRTIEGRRTFVLIDDAGDTAAYLLVPPGLDVESMVARRVGVRGEPRYNPSLRARVIWVRDLVPLDRAP